MRSHGGLIFFVGVESVRDDIHLACVYCLPDGPGNHLGLNAKQNDLVWMTQHWIPSALGTAEKVALVNPTQFHRTLMKDQA